MENPPGCFPDLVNENSSIQLADSQLPYIQGSNNNQTDDQIKMAKCDKKKMRKIYFQMLVATCSSGVIGGHQQVDLASAGNRPNLVVCLCLLFLCLGG